MAKKKTPSTKTASRKAAKSKKATTSRKRTSTRRRAGDEVSIDRRRSAGRRTEDQETDSQPPTPPKLERRKKVQRRRQIDPTTCERDYSKDEIEFMNALDEYKRQSGRMFPTCSEVLEVIRALGYVRLSPAELASRKEHEAIETDCDIPATEDTEPTQ